MSLLKSDELTPKGKHDSKPICYEILETPIFDMAYFVNKTKWIEICQYRERIFNGAVTEKFMRKLAEISFPLDYNYNEGYKMMPLFGARNKLTQEGCRPSCVAFKLLIKGETVFFFARQGERLEEIEEEGGFFSCPSEHKSCLLDFIKNFNN